MQRLNVPVTVVGQSLLDKPVAGRSVDILFRVGQARKGIVGESIGMLIRRTSLPPAPFGDVAV